jgi:hypothetical protein
VKFFSKYIRRGLMTERRANRRREGGEEEEREREKDRKRKIRRCLV